MEGEMLQGHLEWSLDTRPPWPQDQSWKSPALRMLGNEVVLQARLSTFQSLQGVPPGFVLFVQ